MNVLVVPSIRESHFHEFMSKWDDLDWTIIVVEDSPKKSFRLTETYHFAWEDIDQELGDKSWVISHRDSSIRSFGHYMAYKMGADYIFTLDDDCFPGGFVNSRHIQDHLNKLNNVSRWTYSVPGYKTRGVPYQNTGAANNVMLSVGLWEGVPDFDAVQTLGGAHHVTLPRHDFLVARGQYFPMCGMNLCFKREITPLMYFPLMGEGQPYRRFDDIWCGIIAKKIMDHLNMLVSIGEPSIHHAKASNVFTNLVKEAPGIAFNEHFWEIIDGIPLTGDTPAACMLEVGLALHKMEDSYLSRLGQAIQVWVSLFQSKE